MHSINEINNFITSFTINLGSSIGICFYLNLIEDLEDIYLCTLAFIYGEEISLLYIMAQLETRNIAWHWYLLTILPLIFFVQLMIGSRRETLQRLLYLISINIVYGFIFELISFKSDYLRWWKSKTNSGTKIM